MNHKTFVDKIKKSGKADRYGWTTAKFGRYQFRTNGTEWVCVTRQGAKPITRLDKVIEEWERSHDSKTKATRQNQGVVGKDSR